MHVFQECKVTALSTSAAAFQKQNACFNHRVVALVADNNGYELHTLVSGTECTGQPKRKLARQAYNCHPAESKN